jgi:hypothetical protein
LARAAQKTQLLCCRGGVFTTPLHSNGRCESRIESTALHCWARLLNCSIVMALRVTSLVITVPLLLCAVIWLHNSCFEPIRHNMTYYTSLLFIRGGLISRPRSPIYCV